MCEWKSGTQYGQNLKQQKYLFTFFCDYLIDVLLQAEYIYYIYQFVTPVSAAQNVHKKMVIHCSL